MPLSKVRPRGKRTIILAYAATLVGFRLAAAQADAPPPRVCMDSSEARAFACSNGAARRAGDTLVLRLGTGERRIVDASRGDMVWHHIYLGRIGRVGFHVIRLHYYEGPGSTLVVNPRTGRETRVLADLTASPDGERFVTAKPDWNDCQGHEPGLEVFALTDSTPVREWPLKPNSCDAQSGWGAVEPRWRNADTLDFVRSYQTGPGINAGYGRDSMSSERF